MIFACRVEKHLSETLDWWVYVCLQMRIMRKQISCTISHQTQPVCQRILMLKKKSGFHIRGVENG